MSEQPTRTHTAVIVIGGGPAGTTAATLLGRLGHAVVLFERDQHPRFHIGESLLPDNLPVLSELGVLDAVREMGVHKPGADFTQPGEQDGVTFQFSRSLGDSPENAYQVLRSEFDELLFDNCAANGVSTFQGCRVDRVGLARNGRHEVDVVGPDGLEFWSCDYVIDASGRDTLLASTKHWKRKNPKHASAAMFAHFEGVSFRSGDRAGCISVYWFDEGWIWMIPLRDGVMSVGVVGSPALFERRGKKDLDAFFLRILNHCPGARERLIDARLLMSVRATGNYSYTSKRQTGPGYALVGDAFAFIDPVFSSGVFIAMTSAAAIVGVADHWLRGNKVAHAVASLAYRWRIRFGLQTFSWFIYRFTTPTMKSLFKRPRNHLQVERAVISVLAGDVYGRPKIVWRLWFFKAIYGVSVLLARRENWLQAPDSTRSSST